MYSLAYRCSLGYPSNGVKDHTFLPLFFFLKLWLTGKSVRSRCAVASPAEKGWWSPSGLTRYTHKRDLPSIWLQNREADVGVEPVAAHWRESSQGTETSTQRQRTVGFPKSRTRPEWMGALVLQLLPQVFWSFVCAPFIYHLFPGQPKPVYSHLHLHIQPTSKQSVKNHSETSSLV